MKFEAAVVAVLGEGDVANHVVEWDEDVAAVAAGESHVCADAVAPVVEIRGYQQIQVDRPPEMSISEH